MATFLTEEMHVAELNKYGLRYNQNSENEAVIINCIVRRLPETRVNALTLPQEEKLRYDEVSQSSAQKTHCTGH